MTESARQDRAKWSAYPKTVLEFAGPPVVRVDLRQAVTEEAREALRGLGLVSPFAVLTAENPCGENVEDAPTEGQAEEREERNERRSSRLERELLRQRTPFALVDGVSPDGSYREHCLAVALPEADAVELARRLDQLALFWFDGDAFWLLPAEANQAPTRLPVDGEAAA